MCGRDDGQPHDDDDRAHHVPEGVGWGGDGVGAAISCQACLVGDI